MATSDALYENDGPKHIRLERADIVGDTAHGAAALDRATEHERRVVWAYLGDVFLAAARVYVKLDTRNTPLAVVACWKAADLYNRAGMNRRARTAWRYAQLAHAARTREVQG